MAQYASLISVNLSKIYLRSNFEDSIPVGYLETELVATGDLFREIYGMTLYASLLSVDLSQMYRCSKVEGSIPVGDLF